MRPVNLASFDFNLLVVFDALMEERHVSRAADKVGLSQSSLSHALRRLRELFDDELFQRGPQGMQPTARALELAAVVLPGLAQIKRGLKDQAQFDPATSTRRFVIMQPDLGSFSSLPLYMPQLRKEAPGVQIAVYSYDYGNIVEKLRSGEAELAMSIFMDLPTDLDSIKLTSLPFVCIADRNNTYLKKHKKLDVKAFQTLPHAILATQEAYATPVDSELSMVATRRNVALEVSHYLSLPGAIVGTDMIAVFDAHTMVAFADWPELAIYPFPFPTQHLAVSGIWHKRHTTDPGHKWLRDMILNSHQNLAFWTPDRKKADTKHRIRPMKKMRQSAKAS